MPLHKVVIWRIETLAERYLLLDSLLFRLNTTPEKESTVLATSENCVGEIITLYWFCIFGGQLRCH